jgi:hypothetical protein
MFSGSRSSSVQNEMGLNRMGVAWFHHSQTSHSHQTPNDASRTSLRLGRHPKRLRDRAEDLVDVIDIEDEDHSFAAFFIGMKNGGSGRNVKRPLVGAKLAQYCQRFLEILPLIEINTEVNFLHFPKEIHQNIPL